MKSVLIIASILFTALSVPVPRADVPSEAERIAFSDAQEKALDPGKMTIFKAAENGDWATISEYFSDGGVVDCTQLYGGTMLYYAVRGKQAETVKSLLAAGADPTVAHELLKWTPMMLLEHMTTQGGQSRIASLDDIGRMLTEAEAQARDDVAAAEKLQEGPWDTKAVVGFLERKPYQRILSSLLWDACKHGDDAAFEAIMALLTSIPPSLRDHLLNGSYPINDILKRQWLRAVEEKLNAMIYVQVKQMIKEGRVYRNDEPHNKSVSMQVDNQDNPPRQTMLMSAAAQGNARLCGLLIESGADVSLRDAEGRTALDLTCTEWGDPSAKDAITKMLQAKGPAVR